jgi:hypothetical protein
MIALMNRVCEVVRCSAAGAVAYRIVTQGDGAAREELQHMESLSNHIGAKGMKANADQMKMGFRGEQ